MMLREEKSPPRPSMAGTSCCGCMVVCMPPEKEREISRSASFRSDLLHNVPPSRRTHQSRLRISIDTMTYHTRRPCRPDLAREAFGGLMETNDLTTAASQAGCPLAICSM